MTALTPIQWRERAVSALQRGGQAFAREAIRQALVEHPNDVGLSNLAGNIWLKTGDAAAAIGHFARASELDPANVSYTINHAIALTSANRQYEALHLLRSMERRAAASSLYCSSRGNAARGAGQKAEAQEWYDRALAIEPKRARALHGRARVALERGDPAASIWFEKALASNPGDADLWLGKAQALDVGGDADSARELAQSIVDQAPSWAEGLRFLAQLRLEAGDTDFTAHYAEATRKAPNDANIYFAWIATLGGLDYDRDAAEVARLARAAFPDIEHFTLLEATHASASGELEQAERLFAALGMDGADRRLHEARHRIRLGDPSRADRLLGTVLENDPWSISAWALRGVAWRLLDDPRAQWLHEQEGLVRLLPLHDAASILPRIIPVLHDLHDRSPFPLGQSLRGGTQTRGQLFDREHPLLRELHRAIMTTVDRYRAKLPAADAAHPLLRALTSQWSMIGSWSVRLRGGGDCHASHIHPQGILSSALYLDLPEDKGEDPQAGWLEIGRPATDLGLNLEPLYSIEPKAGYLALFPSTLYHGTRPFRSGQRMTVAFDVNLRQG